MDVTIQHLIWWMLHCEISTSTFMNVTMQHQLSLMSQCDKDIVVCRIVTYTSIYATIWHQHSWLSQCHVNFDDVATWHQLCWMSQCDINLDKCHNLTFQQSDISTSTLVNVAVWYFNINFDERHNATSTFINVTMWQRHCCMSHYDIYFDICYNVT
jgi:hypothetical protein